MVKIKVGFSRGIKPSIIGKMIMKVMNTNYSHTYIRLMLTNMVFEAEFVGVRVMDYIKWLQESKVVEEVEFEITEERYEKLLTFIQESKGKRYAIIQLVLILWEKVGGKTIYDNGDSIYICSELVARALADILGIEEDKLDLVTPEDIYNAVKELAVSQQVKAW